MSDSLGNIDDEAALERALSTPGKDLVDLFQRLEGDILLLGVGGKMGLSLGSLAARARDAAGSNQKIYGVSRLADPAMRRKVADAGMVCCPCDLFDRHAVADLPKAPNVLFLAGRKFGTAGAEPRTWASNVILPALVCEQFAASRIVAFSTGCVYPLVSPQTRGCTEQTPRAPVGEYAQSCLGRERIFEYFAEQNGTRVCLYRLNYSVDLRYGVLYDIGRKVWHDEPVDISVDAFNVIWQGDANRYALQALAAATSPTFHLNVTGTRILRTREVAEKMAAHMGKRVRFVGKPKDAVYLNDASACHHRFGAPHVDEEELVLWQAEWIIKGGLALDKPTHFEVTSGTY